MKSIIGKIRHLYCCNFYCAALQDSILIVAVSAGVSTGTEEVKPDDSKPDDSKPTTEKPTTTNPPPTTTKAPVVNCADTSSDCAKMASQGYCQNSLYLSFMAEKCPRSCKKC